MTTDPDALFSWAQFTPDDALQQPVFWFALAQQHVKHERPDLALEVLTTPIGLATEGTADAAPSSDPGPDPGPASQADHGATCAADSAGRPRAPQ
ncbi:hypothetical protein AB0C13_40505 [Streptomyces sp. NPDC049099]|uniref:hypothetical protein n=1 Tax=Streptomyces sp. NPDC049099 TaxID=3155768 RepID=UPI003447BB00